MALTDKKRRFVDALLSGLSGAKAAIHAGYSENGAAQAAARLMRDKHVQAALGRTVEVNKRVNKNTVNKKPDAVVPANVSVEGVSTSDPTESMGLKALGLTSDPRAVLVAIMNDFNEEPKLRMEAAKALMPFTHGKIADQGKKDAQKKAAGEAAASGRFGAPPPPPHLRVVGKG
jgi:phage terminase small subunit